jgi:hypothetical protein
MPPMIPALDAVAAILPKPPAAPALLDDGTFAALVPIEGEVVEDDEPAEAVMAEASLPLVAAKILLAPPPPAPPPDASGAMVAEPLGEMGAVTGAVSGAASAPWPGEESAGPALAAPVADPPVDPHAAEKAPTPVSVPTAPSDAKEEVRVRSLKTTERAESAGRILFEGRHQALMSQGSGPVAAGGDAPRQDVPRLDVPDDRTAGPEVAAPGAPDGAQPALTDGPVPSGGVTRAGLAESADQSAPSPVASQIRHAVQSALNTPVVTHSPDLAEGQGTDRQIELRLDPAELGAVSIVLQGSDDALVVRITAERPDTLDLMRRNSDQLLAELRAAGIGDAQMSFDMGRDPSHTNRSAAEAALMDALEDMPQRPVTSMLQSAPIPAGDTGLFIRV